MIKDLSFGALLKEIRIKNKKTLREYCRLTGWDSSNYSRLERNLAHPPRKKKSLDTLLEPFYYTKFERELLECAAINFHVGNVIKTWNEKEKAQP